MDTRSKLRHLTNINLFRAMTEEQMRDVQQRTVMREIRRKEVLYLPGEPGDRIYLLKRGVVKISALPDDGHEVILALLRPGEVFGEEAVLDDAPRDHMAEAYDDALICVITRQDFLDMMRAFPDLTLRVTKLVGFRLRTFRSRVEGLLFKGTAARLAQTLVGLARDHGVRDDHGVVLPLRLRQSDLANLIGVTRESVNLTLTDFRKRGLVELEGRMLRLLAPEALAAVGQGLQSPLSSRRSGSRTASRRPPAVAVAARAPTALGLRDGVARIQSSAARASPSPDRGAH